MKIEAEIVRNIPTLKGFCYIRLIGDSPFHSPMVLVHESVLKQPPPKKAARRKVKR